jgi:two-component system OmpR family response regulator
MKTKDKPISIFLVDDDKMFLSLLMHALDEKFKSKIDITTFASGEECLAKLYYNPDIVILDYYLNTENINAMNGLSVLKKIRSEKSEIIVIMLSSQEKLEVAVDLFKKGAFEYIVKNESFFVRTENVVKNIISNIDIEHENNLYEKWNYIVGISLLAILLFDLIYYNTH